MNSRSKKMLSVILSALLVVSSPLYGYNGLDTQPKAKIEETVLEKMNFKLERKKEN